MAYWNRQTRAFWALEQQRRRRARNAEEEPDLRAAVIAALFGSGEQGGFWDVSETSSLYQDEAMTTLAGVGDPCHIVADLSGNGNHKDATADGDRPIVSEDNGVVYLAYDNSEMVVPAFSSPIAQPFVFVVAFRITDISATGYVFDDVDNSSRVALISGTSDLQAFAGSVVTVDSNDTTDKVLGCLFDGADSLFSVNGGADVTGNPGANSLEDIRWGKRYSSGSPGEFRFYGAAAVEGSAGRATASDYFQKKTP